MVRIFHISVATLFLLFTVLASSLSSGSKPFSQSASSLERIRQRGKVVMITRNSGSTYYHHRDQPTGSGFDPAPALARYLKVELDAETPGWTEMFERFKRGDGDFIAAGVANDPLGGRGVNFSDRYHNPKNMLGKFDLRAFHRKVETQLPRYKRVIKEVSDAHGFDWRFIAAMIYQESHFNPHAKSFTGVRGIMQVTKRTAKQMGIENRLDPEQSIRAGVSYLACLYDRLEDVSDENDRLLFAIASYNVGYGHVRDAQAIAREKGLDPTCWSSLADSLPLLRKPEFYRKTRFGFARGAEPVRYVENVVAYYNVLKRKG